MHQLMVHPFKWLRSWCWYYINKATFLFYSFLLVCVHRKATVSGLGAEILLVLANNSVWRTLRCFGLALKRIAYDCSGTTGRDSVDLL